MTDSIVSTLSRCIVNTLFELENADENQVNGDFVIDIMESVSAELQGLNSIDTAAFIAAINEIVEADTTDARKYFIENFSKNFGLRSSGA